MPKLLTLGMLVVAAAFPVSVSARRAATVTCGQTLTQSIRLAADLENCPGDGLVVGADGITIDLGGHTIDGSATPETFGSDVGIRDQAFSHLTIENGTVQQFHGGVDLEDVEGSALRGLNLRDNVGRGVLLIRSSGNQIEHNVASGSSRAAIGLVSSDDNVVSDNRTTRNHVGLFAADSSGNEVTGNSFAYNEFTGIETDGVADTRFVGNEIAHGQGGIVLGGDANTVARNRISDIALHCNDDGCPMALSVEGGSNNVVAANTMSGGWIGLRLDDFAPPMTGTIFLDNVVRGAALYGIGIGTEHAGPVGDTLLDGNVATDSGDDGINVQSETTTLTHNRAMNNGDLGIEAVAGVIDGGRNVAHANGNPLECTTVFCG